MRKKLSLLLTVAAVYVTCYGQDNQVVENQVASLYQQFNIKTNLLYDATATFNLGAEFRLSDKSSFELSGNWNPWTFGNNRKWKHVLVRPEYRLWTKETFSGHFFGLHGHYAFYNVGNLPKPPFSQYMKDHRFQGWLAGGGLSYGYRWNFNHRLGMEAVAGVGYAYLSYDQYPCDKCGEKIGGGTRHYVGPTHIGLNLIYSFGKKKKSPPTGPVYVQQVEKKQPSVVLPYTPLLQTCYVVPEAEVVKQRFEEGSAYLDFASGKSVINPSFKGNAAELEKMHRFIEVVRNDPDATITGISIMGFASPEGKYASNLTLSENRAKALKEHIKAMCGFPETMFDVQGKGEDWQTLDSLISGSSMTEKYRILEIIRGTDVFDGRERKLMNLAGGEPYKRMMTDYFPRLRRTEYKLQYTVQPFTVEKGKEVFKTKPSSLSLNEMFLIANTYTPGSDEYNDVLETAARIFPYSDEANLNAAAAALERKDVAMAERYLLKVEQKTGVYYNNTGVLHGLREEWERALEAFGKAKTTGSTQAGSNEAEIAKAIASRQPANHDN